MKLTREGIAVIEGDAYLSQWIIDQGRLDVAAEELEKYREYCNDGVVMDVGASLGDTAATFSSMAYKVHAFEPNPPTFECLAHNMAAYKNVTIYPVGLGDIDRQVKLIEDRHNIGASRLTNEFGSIPVTSLDAVNKVLQMDYLDFLKIDAEGWEPLILDGGVKTIMKLRPVMLVEVNTWPLGEMGYRPDDIWDRLSMMKYWFERFDGPYGDVLCIPREKV